MTSPRCIRVVAGLATILGLFVHAVPATAQLTTAQIARRATPATAVVIALNARGDTLRTGSGFIVRADGVIITAHHVLAGASSAAVRLSTGEVFERTEVMETDAQTDVAVLKIPGFGLPVLTVEAGTPVVGAHLVAIGAPRGLESTVSTGIVSAVRLFDGKQLIQMTAPISPGSSGGPVLDASGRVIAVAVSQIRDGQALNFAVPIRYPMGMIRADRAPRSVAEVFAGARAADAGPEGTPAMRDWTRFPAPATNATAEWLPDAYRFTGFSSITRDSLSWTREWSGVLLIPSEDTGWMIRFLIDSLGELEEPEVTRIVRAYATSRGRILVTPYGLPSLLGYFTDDGGMAISSDTTFLYEGGTVRVVDSLVALPHELPLNFDIGVFELSWRSTWRSGPRARTSGNITTWSGAGAVVVQADSIWVDLSLENETGGTTGLTFIGPITDGEFTLRAPDGSTLKGRIGGGELSAELIDVRNDGSRFEGELYGRRL